MRKITQAISILVYLLSGRFKSEIEGRATEPLDFVSVCIVILLCCFIRRDRHVSLVPCPYPWCFNPFQAAVQIFFASVFVLSDQKYES